MPGASIDGIILLLKAAVALRRDQIIDTPLHQPTPTPRLRAAGRSRGAGRPFAGNVDE